MKCKLCYFKCNRKTKVRKLLVESHTIKILKGLRKCNACGFKYKIKCTFEVYWVEMHEGINQGSPSIKRVRVTQENKHPYTLFYLRVIQFNWWPVKMENSFITRYFQFSARNLNTEIKDRTHRLFICVSRDDVFSGSGEESPLNNETFLLAR